MVRTTTTAENNKNPQTLGSTNKFDLFYGIRALNKAKVLRTGLICGGENAVVGEINSYMNQVNQAD